MSNFIETIRKPGEIQALTMDLSQVCEERDLGTIFNFKWIPQTGACWLSFLAEEVSKSQGIQVRILTPFDDKIRQIEQDLKNERGFEIRDIEEGFRKESLS